jgi:hypothetical protein
VSHVSAGTATLFPEYLIYNLETDPDEKFQDIKNAAAPYNGVGVLEVRMTTPWRTSMACGGS